MGEPTYVAQNQRFWTQRSSEYERSGRRSWTAEDVTWVSGASPNPRYASFRSSRIVTQLDTASRLQREFDLRFPLVQPVAESVPLADDTFDVIVSEYEASIWSDSHKWVPEAGRLLRTDDRLKNDYVGMHRFETTFDESVEFHIGHGDWIRLLRANGFEVQDLVELRPGEDTTLNYDFVSAQWARRWPSEEVWKARRVG